nr:hypothetical protein [Clostridia bacterium]
MGFLQKISFANISQISIFYWSNAPVFYYLFWEITSPRERRPILMLIRGLRKAKRERSILFGVH